MKKILCRTDKSGEDSTLQQVRTLPSHSDTAGSHVCCSSKTPAKFHSALLCTCLFSKVVNEQEGWGNLRYLLFWSTDYLQHITNKQICFGY